MASANDVAAYILAKQGRMPALKLQKLLYYSQAWSLVWDDGPLFEDRIEAWANGPVIPNVYDRHRGYFEVGSQWPGGDAKSLNETQCETVDAVLGFYAGHSGQWLSELTHSEAPWKDARGTLGPGERGNQVITQAAMVDYYSGLPQGA